VQEAQYSYSPRRPPSLRFDPTGGADRLFDLVEAARHRALSEEETKVLAEALRTHEPWLEWAGKREAKSFEVDPVALMIHERISSCHPCELGLEKYIARMVERLRDAIVPDAAEGEPPLLPILNRYKPIGTTTEVDFKTTRPCYMTQRSHINQVVADTAAWEGSAAFRLEQSRAVACYARNDHLGLVIPYEFMGVDHSYEPDFLVRLANGLTLILEVKGFEDEQTEPSTRPPSDG
jgi:hypothetical protein